jgi:hypothetical protein
MSHLSLSTPSSPPDRLVIRARRRGSSWAATARVEKDLSLVGHGAGPSEAVASLLPRVLLHLDQTHSQVVPEIEIIGS